MSAQANAASRQGMLFGDPLEGLDTDEMGYRGPVACSAAGITYRQLDYWARTGLLQPSIRAARGSGSQRLYSFRDILVLKVVKKLLDAGVSLQQVRVAVSSLQNRGVDDLASITLMSDGASVYECTSTDEVIDLLQGGQGVFGIAVGRVWREVEGSLAELPLERSEPTFVDVVVPSFLRPDTQRLNIAVGARLSLAPTACECRQDCGPQRRPRGRWTV